MRDFPPVARDAEKSAIGSDQDALLDVIPVVRRVVSARISDRQLLEDVVQETLVRVMAARDRIERDTLAPYAVAIARNLMIAFGQRQERARRHEHLFLDDVVGSPTDEGLLADEKASLVGTALSQLSPPERNTLLAHEVLGTGTAELAETEGSTPGAVAAKLNRTRAKLRVEYLLAESGVVPPTDRCRPVLYALSVGDRRRQRELDTAGHLLECDSCLAVSLRLFEHRPPPKSADEARVLIASDADVVIARQNGRDVASRAGFSATELTVIATAISEVARNIVKFARRGEIVVRLIEDDGRRGVTVVARDAGPGIIDVGDAMRDGFSTYRGLGLGLAGARRLMDDFHIVSEVGRGTTVTMAKWR